MITGSQIRAGRALLNWSAQVLADESGVGVATIRRMELATSIPSSNAQTLSIVKDTFENAGIEFIGTPNDRPGVRLK